MAVKRRVIWLSDEDWAEISQEAKRAGKTISVYLHSAVTVERHDAYKTEISGAAFPRPAIDSAEQITRTERFLAGDPDPYREFRPVPKPSQKGK